MPNDPTTRVRLESDNPLKTMVIDALQSRTTWADMQREIIRRKKGSRSRVKRKPYRRAPNSVVPIIDDVVREKTDQEMSMMWNAPTLVHVQPLTNMPIESRDKIQRGMDSYIRYIIRARKTVESALNCKNARGMGIFKGIRKFNHLMNQEVSDVAVLDPYDVIVPSDGRIDDDMEWMTHVLRFSKRKFFKKEGKGWQNVREAWNIAKQTDRVDQTGNEDNEERDYLATVADLIGITSSGGLKDSAFIVIWEIYHHATKDMPSRGIRAGDRVMTHMCPDCPDLFINEVPWREEDKSRALTDVEFVEEMKRSMVEGGVPSLREITKGAPRRWPIVQAPFENESLLWHDTRGAGHLCMDDQIEATAHKNAKLVMLEYTQTPLFTGAKPKNPNNFSFEPGTVLPAGTQMLQFPALSQQFDFDINAAKAASARRVGAAGQFNFSTDVGGKNVEKTATEVESENARVGLVSNASVERFNEPLADVWQMLWDDMKRMKLVFPVMLHTGGYEDFDPALYTPEVLILPAASSKTLNPEFQLNRAMGIITNFLVPLRQQGLVDIDISQAVKLALSMWDSRFTAGFMPSPEEKRANEMRIAQLEQAVQMLAQGSMEMRDRSQDDLENISNLSIENSERIEQLSGQSETTQ